mgnify:CR=1 FL=1
MITDPLGCGARWSSILVISADEQERLWAAEIKYYAARDIYHKRDKRTKIKRTTWQSWWESMFDDSYNEYIGKMQKRKGTGLSLHEFLKSSGEL